MTHRRSVILTLPLSLVVGAPIPGGAAQTDTMAPPPIKMGLWQSEVTVTTARMENPAADNDAHTVHTTVRRSCMTSDTWKKNMQAMHEQQHQQEVNCTTTNMQQDAHKMSFDQQCTADQGYNTSVHVKMQLDNEEGMHGTPDIKMSGPVFPQGISMHSAIKSKYLSADCGEIRPGEQRDVKP